MCIRDRLRTAFLANSLNINENCFIRLCSENQIKHDVIYRWYRVPFHIPSSLFFALWRSQRSSPTFCRLDHYFSPQLVRQVFIFFSFFLLSFVFIPIKTANFYVIISNKFYKYKKFQILNVYCTPCTWIRIGFIYSCFLSYGPLRCV